MPWNPVFYKPACFTPQEALASEDPYKLAPPETPIARYSPKTPCYVEVRFLHEMGRELRSRAENWFIRLLIALRVFFEKSATKQVQIYWWKKTSAHWDGELVYSYFGVNPYLGVNPHRLVNPDRLTKTH